MPEPQGWVHARIDWGGHLDTGTAPALRPDAIHIATWPITPFDTTETDCYKVGDQIWIWQPGVGAAHFSLDEHRLHAHPWPGSDSESFRRIVVRSWLPAVYPLWGRQVLHASGLVCPSTGDAVAFTGPTYAGKSTTAYGVSRLGVWQLLSDDTIGFTLGDGTNRLHPLQNETRLRPDSATYHAAPATPNGGLHRSLSSPPALLLVVMMMRVTTASGHQQFDQLMCGFKLGIVATLWDQGQRRTGNRVHDQLLQHRRGDDMLRRAANDQRRGLDAANLVRKVGRAEGVKAAQQRLDGH